MRPCPRCKASNQATAQYCSACGESFCSDSSLTEIQTAPETGRVDLKDASYDQSVHGRFLPGVILSNRYRIVSLVGRGGMGEVYRADDLKLGQPVALKFLPERTSKSGASFELFLQEVRLSRQITHLNVCRVYDIGESDGHHFLSMEFIDGEDLRVLLRRVGSFPSERGIRIAQQICAGLAAAHQGGVLHRDLKPSNIIIDGHGNARITDFGVARLTVDRSSEHQRIGTPAYMAPEQKIHGETSFQSDIYSLGLVLREVFYGNTDTTVQPSTSHSRTTETDNQIAPEISQVIDRCLETDPRLRPRTVGEVAAALPGGDSLQAAQEAGETPSPELVAAAGGEGTIEPQRGRVALALVLLGLFMAAWHSDRIHPVNLRNDVRHPQSLSDQAEDSLRRFGYSKIPKYSYFDYKVNQDHELGFWYRASPIKLINRSPFRGAAELSLGQIEHHSPAWNYPGELGIELDPSGKLLCFRAIPDIEHSASIRDKTAPRWAEWFPPALIGFDLEKLETISAGGPLPPDPFDDLQVWKSSRPDKNESVYLQAASLQGRPSYFRVLTQHQFNGNSHIGPLWRPHLTTLQPKKQPRGTVISATVGIVMLLSAVLLAWQNTKTRRSDPKGSKRVGIVFGIIAGIAWCVLSGYRDYDGQMNEWIFIGTAWMLCIGGRYWLAFTALEPVARKHWPHSLSSWNRLISGKWKDPLVGRNLLYGVLVGVFSVNLQLIFSHAALALDGQALGGVEEGYLTLGNVWHQFGFVLNSLLASAGYVFGNLMILLLFRTVIKQVQWSALIYILAQGTLLYNIYECDSNWEWIWFTSWAALNVLTLNKLGFLGAFVMTFTHVVLMIPLTSDLSKWYATHGFGTMVLIAVLGSIGYRQSVSRSVSKIGY